ncbi:hypothetical protein EV356DRAFT_517509 [Viridothelium virens]|uniref:Inheritance of peroxisomes protein 1 n=1 Tax=Viridothelium virens TaxID=1048519 RepID=A0A6A6H3D3_VIRVR|nr:hypothetical protein EV356DRAFT_517509 [Viridothelium virens]
MASAATPFTPGRGPPPFHQGVRRSFTEPTKLAQSGTKSSDATQPPPDTIENLFTCIYARVVSFDTPSRDPVRNASFTDPGRLSWTSLAERTVAAGPLRIDRVPGSVSFLNFGNISQPILPRSQCWCVDDESTFVLRRKINSYYRIEMPNDTTTDQAKIEEIKSVFQKVLYYEKTACPFKKYLSNELPEEPETPTPRGRLRPTGRARKWKHNKFWQPEDGDENRNMSSDRGSTEYSDSDASRSTSTNSATQEASVLTESLSLGPEVMNAEGFKPLLRPKTISAMRSVTSPPQLNLQASPTSKSKDHNGEVPSLSSSLDSFHSVNSQVYYQAEERPESGVDPTEDEPTPRLAPPTHSRDVSDVTIVVEPSNFEKRTDITSSPLDDDVEGSVPSTPTLVSDTEEHLDPQGAEVVTPPDSLRLREPRRARYRSVSPFTQDPSTLLMRTQPQARHLAGTIIRKTYEILTSPPQHLISIMLRIAARLAGSIGLAAAECDLPPSTRIPCSWDSEEEGIDWDEQEDYSFRLKPLEHSLDTDPD